jgi:FkbM family methyltransferase
MRPAIFYISRKTVRPFLPLIAKVWRRSPLAARKVYISLFSPFAPDVIEVYGQKIALDFAHDGTSRILALTGSYEEYQTRLFRGVVKEGMTVVDLGANIGYYSLLAAALVGEEGKVFAFEPEPNNFASLVKNIRMNSYNNIVPIQKAVTNKTGALKLFCEPSQRQAANIYNYYNTKAGVTVECVTLDDFFKDKGYDVDIIKMDIEGAQMLALEGMEEIIKRNDDLIIFAEPGESLQEFLSKLTEYGFRLYLMNERKQCLEPLENFDRMIKGEQIWNLLCKKH